MQKLNALSQITVAVLLTAPMALAKGGGRVHPGWCIGAETHSSDRPPPTPPETASQRGQGRRPEGCAQRGRNQPCGQSRDRQFGAAKCSPNP